MGLARVVRSMEILGRALIDMRDAPDAQVVLEIAVVRATRPDLDSGIEALTERVAALERGIASGGAPGRAAAHAEAAAPAPRRMPESAPPASAPQQASAPTPSSAPQQATAPPPVDVARRPSVGAVLRRQQGASEADASPARGTPVGAAPAPSSPSAAAAQGAPRTGATRVIDRDSLTQAWGDSVLRNLPARVKALFSAGRFVAADQNGAQFALPNAAHRDRCAESVSQVEAALSAHFGAPVTLALVVDGGSPGGPSAGVARPGAPPPPSDAGMADLEEEDPGDLMPASGDETDHMSAAEARLLEAFPGTSEVAE